MTLHVGISSGTLNPDGIAFVQEAERLGADSVWVPEFWAADALTPIGYLAAVTSTIRLATGIVQLGARTPAMLAMSAMSLQELTGGRFVLGVGTSGPQVMEGWHGVRFDRPVARTRDTIEIIRAISRGERLDYQGSVYTVPLPDSDGRSIRSLLTPTKVPIYVASLGPANLRMTGELADGWIGNSFMPESAEVFLEPIAAGAASVGRDLSELDLTVSATVEFTDDVAAASRRHADGYAFTFGAMGSASRNFYNEAFARQGFGDDVREVERLWRAGDKAAAARRVPAEIGFRTNLLGTDALIRDRLRLYRDAGITTIRVQLRPEGPLEARIEDLGRLLDLVGETNSERTVSA
jgi:F420-dependent oxidoreductase-like protein